MKPRRPHVGRTVTNIHNDAISIGSIVVRADAAKARGIVEANRGIVEALLPVYGADAGPFDAALRVGWSVPGGGCFTTTVDTDDVRSVGHVKGLEHCEGEQEDIYGVWKAGRWHRPKTAVALWRDEAQHIKLRLAQLRRERWAQTVEEMAAVPLLERRLGRLTHLLGVSGEVPAVAPSRGELAEVMTTPAGVAMSPRAARIYSYLRQQGIQITPFSVDQEVERQMPRLVAALTLLGSSAARGWYSEKHRAEMQRDLRAILTRRPQHRVRGE